MFPILHTPFTSDGEVDFDSLRRLVSHAGALAEGLVFPGFASEFWRLNGDEIAACAEIIVQTAPPHSRVILNVTPQASVTAVRQAREFEKLGAHALMVLPPFTVPAPVDLLERHLEEILGGVEIPWIVQDSAGLTGVSLDAQSLARLKSSRPLFSALKVDQVPTGPAISRYRAMPELADLSFIVGYSGVQMLDAVRRGAEGLMGGCGHLPEDRRMLTALLNGNGYGEFARLAPLLNFEMQTLELVIAVHKRLLYEAGVIATPLSRAPSRAMDEVHAEELRMHMNAVGRQ
ncbi:MAG: dihydrodipicolinate synthase family protein [Acidobacteria bacterium]|nr:dihydrodipicolinate synthase family protein [Acidobacteriota bacterium]